MLLILVINGVIRGMGNTRVPMYIALVVNIFNIFFDYVLIFGKLGFPALGVKGAALATGSAQAFGLTVGLFYLYRRRGELRLTRRSFWPMRKPVLKSILSISLPVGMEEVVYNVSRLISITWIAALGPISFAANTAAVAAESFSFMPGYAFSLAATTLVGQHLGAGQPDEALRTGNLATIMATVLMSAIASLFYFFPHFIMRIFDPPRSRSSPSWDRLSTHCRGGAALYRRRLYPGRGPKRSRRHKGAAPGRVYRQLFGAVTLSLSCGLCLRA